MRIMGCATGMKFQYDSPLASSDDWASSDATCECQVTSSLQPWCNVQDLQGNVVGGLGIAWSVLRGRLAYTMSIKVYSSTTQSAATCKPRLEPVAPHTAISIFADLAFLPVGPGRGRGLWVLNYAAAKVESTAFRCRWRCLTGSTRAGTATRSTGSNFAPQRYP